MTVVATVGTTHPLAFAGLTFALRAIAAEGLRPVCVVAGVSAQDAAHVLALTAVDAVTIRAQFEALRGADVRAFHVGALVSGDAVRAVAAGLAAFAGVPVVLDPVLAATGGDALADAAATIALRESLIPLATLVTPNLDEAAALLERDVRTRAGMHEAAVGLVALGATAALVKGGHAAADPAASTVVDVLADARGTRTFTSPRAGPSLRGTGDLLASTVAAHLARGADLDDAIERARARVHAAIVAGTPFAGTRVAQL